MTSLKRALVLLITVLSASPLLAWGDKGHTIINEAATIGLPADMPYFFLSAFPELTYLGPEPDRIKNAGDSQDAVNLPDHQIDLEETYGLELPHSRYAFMEAMTKADIYRKHGLTHDHPGYLPWRIAELSQYLQKLFAMWRTADPSDRRAIEREAITVAGLLGHYVADASQPLHTTIHYNGWLGPNPNGYANDCEIHSRFETAFVSHAITRDDVIPRVAPPEVTSDYFATGLALIKDSNSAVERLYAMDRDHGFDVLQPAKPESKEFVVARLAKGASVLRDLWFSAWKNSALPPRSRRR
ncbi:MAG TPA: nuclease [Thermoanaerobaculia bacterium]